MSVQSRQAADVLAALRTAAVAWAKRVGNATAAAELGVDERTVRRRREEGGGWTDAEIAAIAAHELQTEGTSHLVAELVEAAQPPTENPEQRALQQQVLLAGAELSQASSLISRRLADNDLSGRDAALIAGDLEEILRQGRVLLRRLHHHAVRAAQP